MFRYDGAGRRLVLGLKHGDRQDVVPMLADWMLRAGRPLVEGADMIAPVPLHWTRRLKRRGNQAATLARRICHRAGLPGTFAPRLLVRNRATPSQDGRNRGARVENLAGALSLGPGTAVEGQRILLIDDVLTTGATLSVAAEVLQAAGAASVDILVLALVVRDDPAYIDPGTEGSFDETSRDLYDPDLPLLHDGEAASGSEGRRLHRDQRDG
ncbi:MAG: ComF family protein [Pseudomonadota bacterium]